MFFHDTNPHTNRLFSLNANNRGEAIWLAGAIGAALDAVRLQLTDPALSYSDFDFKSEDSLNSFRGALSSSSDIGVAVNSLKVDGQFISVSIDVEQESSWDVMVDATDRSVSSITQTWSATSGSSLATAKQASDSE